MDTSAPPNPFHEMLSLEQLVALSRVREVMVNHSCPKFGHSWATPSQKPQLELVKKGDVPLEDFV